MLKELPHHEFNSSKYEIRSCDILQASKFCGEPRDVVYFVVSEKTKHIDILSVIKYATTSVILVLMKDVPFNFLRSLINTPKYSARLNLKTVFFLIMIQTFFHLTDH